MKRINYKLWLGIAFFCIAFGIISLFLDSPMEPIREEGYEMELDTESDSFISGIGENFGNFLRAFSDFYHVVVKGEESRYSSGLDALKGEDPIIPADESDADFEAPASPENNVSITDTISAFMESGQTDEDALLTSAVVEDVVDGDTIYADVGGVSIKIRLIGIDTPESVHADESRNNEFGNMASEYTKSIISEGQVIYLEYDEEPEDKYGRTLAYVWLSNNTENIENMLNYKLLADGYAVDKKIPPNRKYADVFAQTRITSEQNKTGLWEFQEFKGLWEVEDV